MVSVSVAGPTDMPTYTYRCPECKHTLTKVHKITEDPMVPCPECDTEECEDTPAMDRVVSGIRDRFLLKGKGWDSRPDHNCH